MIIAMDITIQQTKHTFPTHYWGAQLIKYSQFL